MVVGWVVIVAAVVGGCCLFCGSALVLTGVTILIIVYVSKKKGKGYSIFSKYNYIIIH